MPIDDQFLDVEYLRAVQYWDSTELAKRAGLPAVERHGR
jgi:hypothetical protein